MSKFHTKKSRIAVQHCNVGNFDINLRHTPNLPLTFRFSQHKWDAREVGFSKMKKSALGDLTKSAEHAAGSSVTSACF